MEIFRTLKKVSGHPGKLLGTLKNFKTLWEVYGHSLKFQKKSWKFLDTLENLLNTFKSLWALWKISRPFGMILDSLENFQNLWEFLDTHEFFRTLWEVFRYNWKFPVKLKSFQTLQINFGTSKKSLRIIWKNIYLKYQTECNIQLYYLFYYNQWGC